MDVGCGSAATDISSEERGRVSVARATNLVIATGVLAALVMGAGPGNAPQPNSPQPATTARAVAVVQQSKPPSEPKPVKKINCRRAKCVALTFDDGPVPQTKAVLNALRQRGARATFFVLGSQATRNPQLLRRMVREGNVVGNHSWDHAMFTRLSYAGIRSELQRTQRVITAATGEKNSLVRVPYGENDSRIRRDVTRSVHAPTVLWSVDPLDWKYRNSNTVWRNVMKAVRPGSIVLLHDIHPTTRAAVPRIIRSLQARGYVLVTVPELFNGHLKAGRSYFRR